MTIDALTEGKPSYLNVDPNGASSEQSGSGPARGSSNSSASPRISGPLAGLPERSAVVSAPTRVRLPPKTDMACSPRGLRGSSVPLLGLSSLEMPLRKNRKSIDPLRNVGQSVQDTYTAAEKAARRQGFYGPQPSAPSTRLDATNALDSSSAVASAPTRIQSPPKTDMACSDVEACLPHAEARTALQKITSYGVPVVDAAAAGLSLAASRLPVPVAQKVTGALSGSLWAGGAAASELGNASRSNWESAANVLSAAAGALSAAAPFVSGKTASGAAYGAAGSWAANGTANMMRAACDGRQSTASRLLQGASGTANFAAAGLAAAAANASSNNDSVKAANLGTVSSVLWAVGAVAATGAVWTARSGKPEDPPA
jgi:hypothetical protein